MPDENQLIGKLSSEYFLMRLRMYICGTAGPTEEDWEQGLRDLLNHLKEHPMSSAQGTLP